jgi:hypothetical protein
MDYSNDENDACLATYHLGACGDVCGCTALTFMAHNMNTMCHRTHARAGGVDVTRYARLIRRHARGPAKRAPRRRVTQ